MNKVKKFFIRLFKKEEELNYPNEFALIISTDSAIENNITDKFNKKIVIYKKGKIFEEIPYTEADVKNLIEIREIPVVEKNVVDSYDFQEEPSFGEIIT